MSELKQYPICESGNVAVYDLFNDQKQLGIKCQRWHLCGRFCTTLEEETSACNMRSESAELTTLREQVKMLREALEKTVEATPVISFSHKGAFEYISAIEKARLILEQTKPKDEMEAKI